MKKGLLFSIVFVLVSLMSAMSAYATGEVPEISGGQLKITEAGTYRFVGSMRGSVLVDPGEGDVFLIMDNFSVDGGQSAGIVALSGDSLTISLADHSENKIMDGGSDDQFNAAIYSRIPTFFEGNGSLEIQGNNFDAIRVENADLTFNGGHFDMNARNDAIAVDGDRAGTLTFDGGYFNIEAGNNILAPDTNLQFNDGMVREADVNGNFSYPSWSDPYKNLEEAVVTPASQTMQPMDQSGFFYQDRQPGNQQATSVQPWTFSNQAGNSSSSVQTGSNTTPAQSGQFGQNTMPSQSGQYGQNTMPEQMDQNFAGNHMPGMNMNTNWETSAAAGEIVSGTMTNSAMNLTADYDNATTITVSEDNSQVKISDSGTYVVTGSSSDGNITVKKETTGVVLVLQDLDLTSTTGATVSINKNAEVKVIVSGNVTLTDNENPADENSSDADIADAFDGAALKAKAGSQVYITGDGTLTINGNAKNGIKGGDDSSIIIDGVTMNIKAANDGINSNYDVTLLSGDFTIEAEDDAIHADHILTIGDEKGHGPTVNVKRSNEGLEGTVVNIFGGDITVNSSDDAINAANGDGVYEGELDYSLNMTGGKLTIKSQGDGLDSNGNINLIGGSANISSATNGGEAGIDYDGQLYISDSFQLNNNSGVAGPDGMPGGMEGQNFGPMNGNQQNSSTNSGGQQSGGYNPGSSSSFSGQQSGGYTPGNSSSFSGQQSGGYTPGSSSSFGGQQSGGYNPGSSSSFGGQQSGGYAPGGSSSFGGGSMSSGAGRDSFSAGGRGGRR